MRLTEDFTGCRVLAYCLMANHFHILLEVPPRPADTIPDHELLRRLAIFYPAWKVEEQRRLLAEARKSGHSAEIQRILHSHTYRMNDLSEFMKILLQRFTSWFNRRHQRSGRLWEQRFKSVLVESGFAAQTVAAYIDLNPVRAGICQDPAAYPWCSHADALSGSRRAKTGLARIQQYLTGNPPLNRQAPSWEARPGEQESLLRAWSQGGLSRRYQRVLLGKSIEVQHEGQVVRKGIARDKAVEKIDQLDRENAEHKATSETSEHEDRISQIIRHRVRHFTDGSVIGGREFVDEVFRSSRDYFGPQRRTGARKPRGALQALEGEIWTARDLKKDVV
jgi:REP element-mobilizing transposase RayT